MYDDCWQAQDPDSPYGFLIKMIETAALRLLIYVITAVPFCLHRLGGVQGQNKSLGDCQSPSVPCQNGGTCTNSGDGYYCACFAGWSGKNCTEDVDECRLGSHECHLQATCNNTKGSYDCLCKPGYSENGRGEPGCIDIDLCSLSKCRNSSNTTICINSNGLLSCVHDAEHDQNGRLTVTIYCDLLDTYRDQSHNCSANATCRFHSGSVHCSCLEGYSEDGYDCTANGGTRQRSSSDSFSSTSLAMIIVASVLYMVVSSKAILCCIKRRKKIKPVPKRMVRPESMFIEMPVSRILNASRPTYLDYSRYASTTVWPEQCPSTFDNSISTSSAENYDGDFFEDGLSDTTTSADHNMINYPLYPSISEFYNSPSPCFEEPEVYQEFTLQPLQRDPSCGKKAPIIEEVYAIYDNLSKQHCSHLQKAKPAKQEEEIYSVYKAPVKSNSCKTVPKASTEALKEDNEDIYCIYGSLDTFSKCAPGFWNSKHSIAEEEV